MAVSKAKLKTKIDAHERVLKMLFKNYERDCGYGTPSAKDKKLRKSAKCATHNKKVRHYGNALERMKKQLHGRR